MRFGYSMLQQDAIAAEDLTYGLCEELLVVCPVCKEGVFKKVRQNKHTETHYLSHYQNTLQSAECELRTKDLTHEQIKNMGAGIVRGQSMEEFYLSFQEIFYTVFTDPSCADPEFDIYLEIKKTLSNPNFNWYFNQLIAELQNPVGRKTSPMWKIPLSELPMEFLYVKLLDKAWRIAGIKTLPSSKTIPHYVNKSSQFALDILDHISNLQQTSLLRFLVAASFTMCLRPNVDNDEMAEAMSNVMIILGSKINDLDFTVEKYTKEMQKYGNFYDVVKAIHPVEWSLTTIGEVVLEMTDRIFRYSKMKFSQYVKKWWEKGDILSLEHNEIFSSRQPVAELAAMNRLSTVARVQTHGLVMLYAVFLVSLITMMPAGRKYFRSNNAMQAE